MRKHLKDYFIPHEGNGYKPHSLQKAAMTGMVALVLLSFTLANVQSLLWVASDWMVGAVLPAVIVDMVNDERSDDSLGQLRRNAVLDAAAQQKAEHMAAKEYFAHFSPDGVSPWFFFNQANYNFVNAGENLAIHFTDTKQLVAAWMKSPTHRANIMNGAYTEIGIGTAEGEFEGFKTLYVVQFFGTPAGVPALVTPSPVAIAQAQEIEVTPEVLGEEVQAAPVEETETEVLAEAVEISEIVEIIEADPVPVVIQTEETPDQVVVETIADASTEEVPDSLYSDFVATTTGGVPASIDPTQLENAERTPYFLKVMTQPHMTLQVMYVAVGLLVLVSLIFSIFIELRKQNPMQIAYSVALLLLMFGLFKIHEILSISATIV